MKIIPISAKAQHGKDTVAGILKELMESDGNSVLIAHYADLLKYICKTFFNWDGKKDNAGRTILQYVGTDIIREQNPDYWVSFLSDFLKMFYTEWDYVIIPDSRFPNEIEYLIENGWDIFSVRVNRTDFESNLTEEQKNHISETALDNYKFDYYIDSPSGIENLTDKVVNLWSYLKAQGRV